jgi:hypothetical protein
MHNLSGRLIRRLGIRVVTSTIARLHQSFMACEMGSGVSLHGSNPEPFNVRFGSWSCRNPRGLWHQRSIELAKLTRIGCDYALIAAISG